MTCTPFRSPDGKTIGFICTRGSKPRAPCMYCRTTYEFLCDHRDKPKAKRCSRKLCAKHAHEIGDNLHVCPDHVAAKPTAADHDPVGSDSTRQSADRTLLQVHTAHINWHRKDVDAFDVTIMTGGPEGRPFAPSMEIFRAARQAIAEADEWERLAKLEEQIAPDHANGKRAEAVKIRLESWAIYRRAFLAEMLVSADRPVPDDWRADVRTAGIRGVESRPEAWAALLARKRVVLLCYCPTREFCHRGLLVSILVRMGAVDAGELAKPESVQAKLFGT